MLQNIRESLTGPIMWVIVGIIVVPFAFFGIETLRTGGGDPAVVKVDGQKITESQIRRGTEQRMRRLQQLMGENFRPDMVDTQRFREAVIEDMTQEMLLRQRAQDGGYRASDASLFDAISQVPAFQEDGKFSTEAYRARVSQMGYSLQRFEAEMRDSLVMDQLRQGVLASSFVTDAEAGQAWRIEKQKRDLRYLVFPLASYLPKVNVTDEQVSAHYESNKARYQAPERLQVAYVELALADLPEAPAPAEEVLKALYEAEKNARFASPEERRASHILVNFGADKAEARKRIEQLAEMVRKGSDFASLAGSQSDDPGSKSKGGDLGWIKRGQMLEKFEEALFALQPGQVSEPVETEFGWHLIKLTELREASVKPLSDPAVRGELVRVYRQRDAERRFQEMSEKLEQQAFESPTSLDPVKEALGLEIKTSSWMTRGSGEDLFANQALRDAAFSDDVVKANENSKPLPAGDNRVVVLRKHAYEPQRQKALEEVADAIREELKARAASEQATQAAEAALKAVREGEDPSKVARDNGAELKSPGLVGRREQGVEAPILAALFQLPHPGEKGAWSKVALPSGDLAVVGALKIEEADFAAAPEQERAQLMNAIRNAQAGSEFEAYRADLKRRAEIKRFESAAPAGGAPEAPDAPGADEAPES